MVEVHNDSVFVCILGENGDKIQEKFGENTTKNKKRSYYKIGRAHV